MNKKYVMFVDECSIPREEFNDEMLLAGIIFDYEYYKNTVNEFKERIYNCLEKSINNTKAYNNDFRRVSSSLYDLMKAINFKIILSSFNRKEKRKSESYDAIYKKLIKDYYSFLDKEDSVNGHLILRENQNKSSHTIQNFFDTFNELKYEDELKMKSSQKINGFIVCQNNDEDYKCGFAILEILKDVFRFINKCGEIRSKENEEDLFSIIQEKLFEEIVSEDIRYNKDYESMMSEISFLKKNMELKNKKIKMKEEEIAELTKKLDYIRKEIRSFTSKDDASKVWIEL